MPRPSARHLGPDVVRSTIGMAVELDLEERPGESSIDGAVAVEQGVTRVRGLAEPVALPGRFADVPAERRRPSPRGTRRLASGHSRNAGRVRTAAMWTACPLSWSSSRGCRCLPPRTWRRPTAAAASMARSTAGRGPGAHPEVNATGIGGRPGPGSDVVPDPEPLRVRPEGRQVAMVEVEQRPSAGTRASSRATAAPTRTSSPMVRRARARRRTATRRGSRGGHPRASRPAGRARPHSPRSASRRGASVPRWDGADGDTDWPSPPSPSTARQSGSMASNRRRRAAGSGSLASRARTVSRSSVSGPTRIELAASP